MSLYGSQKALHSSRRSGSRTDLTGGGANFERSEVVHGGGNGYGPPEFMDGYYSLSKTSMGGGMGGGQGGSALGAIHQKAYILQGQCQDYLRKSEHALQSGGDPGHATADADRFLAMAKETMEQLKSCAVELRHMGQPNDNVVRSVEICRDQLRGVHMLISGTMQRKSRSSRGSGGGWEEAGRSFNEAVAWIGQQKRLIETSSWGDDAATIEQQLLSHSKFHSSIQRNPEVDRARDELMKKGDKANLHALDQEWDSLQQLSFGRTSQLRELQHIIKEISKEIMWVNEREEEELVFDWGDKNIDAYIPTKQESYSKLMSALEEKEKDLNKVKVKVDALLKNNHPASDKIEAYMDTLQTQWSWLLQITKCIHVHLKENATYSQFFKEANETYGKLQMEHEFIRKKFTCDKNTPMDNLDDLLKALEKEKEKLMEHKMQVKRLVSKSKNIVRLKPRNPEEKGNATSPIIVKALCDFKQDQRAIFKDNEAILKDNSQRSKWQVTGPGGLEMVVPSVCLLVPPPNPLSISLANKNEQYYEAILAMWNQFYINIKSLISWQHCLMDIKRINSFTVSMLANMRPEEYRSIIRSLETHFEEFKLTSHGSQMFEDEDKRSMETQYTGAQSHYEQLVVQLPTYTAQQQQQQVPQQPETLQQQVIFLQQQPAPPQQQVIYLHQQQAYNDQAARQQAAREQAARDQAARDQAAREQAAREQAAREQAAMEQAAREQAAMEQAAREQAARLQAAREQIEREQAAREQAAREQAAREQAAREQAARDQAARDQAAREQAARLQAAREQVAKREEVLRAESKNVNREVIRTKEVMVVRKEPAKSQVVSSSHSLTELHALRLKLEAAEGSLSQHMHVCLGEDGAHDCGLRINQLEGVQRDIDSIREEYLRLKERILKELDGMTDSDKSQFLRSDINLINQRLSSLESGSSAYLQRLRALRALLESVAHAEDLVKVHEARLTEKETTSLTPGEVEDYMYALKNMKVELDQRRDLLTSMDVELRKANHWDGQMGSSSHRCDLMLSKYGEQVSQLSDRWRRIGNQMDCRQKDLELYLTQLQHYKRSSTSLSEWIDTTRKKQDSLQATKIEDIKTLNEHISQQKAMHSEIKSKRDAVESVLRDTQTCVNTIKDHEMELASYSSGLETLLNIPIKRTLLQSPSTELTHEATLLQTRYIELLTLSGDYYKYLGEMLKNFEELKMRNTRIDLLEEELRLLKDDIRGRDAKNQSLEEAIGRYRLELSQSQNQLLSEEEVKRNTALQCSSTRDSLESTKTQLVDLNNQLGRLGNQVEDEKRKRKLAEERYSDQQVEYEAVLRRRQKELDEVNWAKVEVEKGQADKERQAEQLRRQLNGEEARVKELELQLSKVRSQCSVEIANLKLNYESLIHVSHADLQQQSAQGEEEMAQLRQQSNRLETERSGLEVELKRLQVSVSQAEEHRRRAEGEAHSQRSVCMEESRRRTELEAQVEALLREREEESGQHREDLVEVAQKLREKTDLVSHLSHSLEEETRRRSTVEEGQAVMEKTLGQLQTKLTSSSVTTVRLRECEEELVSLRLELERERGERKRVEKNSAGQQARIKDLQSIRDGLESQVETLRTGNQEEVAKRTRVEAELEQTLVTVREYTSTITSLRHSQQEASVSGQRGEEALRRLQGELERSSRDHKASTEQLTQLSAELKALQQKMLQEQARVREANTRNESLYKTIEERSRLLNDKSSELERQQGMTESLTKERLRLEEELRAARQENEELRMTMQRIDTELSSQITALELQLQSSTRSSLDYQRLVSELSSERQKLKLEVEQTQKQAIETTSLIQSTQLQYNEVVRERDALLQKLKLSDDDKSRTQMFDDDLNRLKLSLESEQRQKRLLSEENEKVKKDFLHWKGQYEIREDLVRQYNSDKERLEREGKGLKSEVERLMRELALVNEKYTSNMSSLQTEMVELKTVKVTMEKQLSCARDVPKIDPCLLFFDGVRKQVNAQQLLDCGVLDKLTFNQLIKGEKIVPEVAEEKKICLKGTGPIAGVFVGPKGKKSLKDAKKENLMTPESADLLLDAQAATGHIIDPIANKKLTVEEACDQGVVDEKDRARLLEVEAAAVGYRDPKSTKPLSAFQAMKKGLIDQSTALRLLQAQESVGGILDPVFSVFLPKDTAIERGLIDEDMYRSLNQRPECYLDPDTQERASYVALKRKCDKEPRTGLLLLPVPDLSALVFEGVRKPVTAQQLLDCGVLEKPTFNQLIKGQKTVPEVAEDKKISLKGTGPIAGVVVGQKAKKSLTEAKKENLISPESADLLLDAQAATGHIIDPIANKKLTVEEAVAKGVVDKGDKQRLLAAEAAAVGYQEPNTAKPLSAFQAMKKGLIDQSTALRLLQAQESVGGILDPVLSVFLPIDIAKKRDLIDDELCRALSKSPECYLDPDTQQGANYDSLKKKCKDEPTTGLLLLPAIDLSSVLFDGVRKPVTAQQLLDCGVLDKPTLNQLVKGQKTITEVAQDKTISLKGTGPIGGVIVGSKDKKSLTEAKKENLISQESADLLLDAQAATGHIIDPIANTKLTVDEAVAKGVVDKGDKQRLLAAEAAAVGYLDPNTAKPLSAFQAMKKGLIDQSTALRLLQAQESVGGILDPVFSVFLPKDTAIERGLIDEDMYRSLNQRPECYLDPDTQESASYVALKRKCDKEPRTGLLLLPVPDLSALVFEGVRKPVTAQQLLDCGVLDKPTFNQLIKGQKTVPRVAEDKKISLKGTGPIAGVVVGQKAKKSLTEAKKENLISPESADLLLDAQAATGHIIDPIANKKLTVDEAVAKGVVDKGDKQRLLAAEAAAVGYQDPNTAKPLSAFQAMKKGLIDKNTALRLLQAQVSVGGVLDPVLSVFLPIDTAKKRDLIDDELCRLLSKSPECYLDPDTQQGANYDSLKKKCKAEPTTGLLLLPAMDLSSVLFDGVRKPVTAQQLLDCDVLDKPTLNQLVKGQKTIPEVAQDKKISLKGTGPIGGVIVGSKDKKSLTEAKKENLISPESADLLLDAQAATGHIIDPITNKKLTVEEAVAKGVVDKVDKQRLLAAEAAAVGYQDPNTAKPLSAFQAMKKGLIDKNTALRLLQAQVSAGGVLDPVLSVFLPIDTAKKRDLIDDELCRLLSKSPECYLDPDTQQGANYDSLKKKCKAEPTTGLLFLPAQDTSSLVFDGVRKPVTAQQLLDCGILDRPTFNQLVNGQKTIAEVAKDKMINLKGTGPIGGVIVGSKDKKSLTEAKKENLISQESTDLLLDAQAATGHIIDPITNKKLTVEEAVAKGVVDKGDKQRLLAAEAAAVGYQDPNTAKPLSAFQAMKKGLIDKNTALRLLQAQVSVGGVLDPVLSVFLPIDTAKKRDLIDDELCRALSKSPECYLDPDTQQGANYDSLKKKCKAEPTTGLLLLPAQDTSSLVFDGVRKPVTAQQLLDCGILDRPTFNMLVQGQKTVSDVSVDKKLYLKGTGIISGVASEPQGKISLTEAKKKNIMSSESADLLLDAQAATGHIMDPGRNQKLTVEEAVAKGVVDKRDKQRLLTAEAAAVGFRDPNTAKPLSVFQAMKKGLIDKKTALRLLQAQEAVGGILDPVLSVFLPVETAKKRDLIDQETCLALKQSSKCYLDPDTQKAASYLSLKKRCKAELSTGLLILPAPAKPTLDPSSLLFDGVRKQVTAQQLFDCGVLDKTTLSQLVNGQKTVSEVSIDKKVNLKGTGVISGVAAGPRGKVSLTEAKRDKIMSQGSADLLLDAQAATGHIIDLRGNRKLTVEEACARGVVSREDKERLLTAEAAVVGFQDPNKGKPLSVGQAMKKGLINRDTALLLLQAQESVGGIFDPNLSVFLPKDTAKDRGLIDEDLYKALNQSPECYLDPDNQLGSSYAALTKRCKAEPSTGLLILPTPAKPVTVQGLRSQVSITDLVDSNLLGHSDIENLRNGKLTSQDIELRLRSYLRGSTCIAGVYDEASGKTMPIYQAMKEGLLRPGTSLELLEAQAASGFIIDPVKNLYLTVSDAFKTGLAGPEFKDTLLSAERAVTGYQMPGSKVIISLFQAIEKGLIEKGHGIRLLEAQIASGGIIDPMHSHRIEVEVAYKKGYFGEEMNKILSDEGDDTKGFFDPNTEDNLTYLQLKNRCITDKKTGLVLLPIKDKKKKQQEQQQQQQKQTNTRRKRRVVIVDPDTNKEMTIREAYEKELIDYATYLELSQQESEWEEITITATDGSSRQIIIDRKTGNQYDLKELLEQGVIEQSQYDQYQSKKISLTQLADIVTSKTKHLSSRRSSVILNFFLHLFTLDIKNYNIIIIIILHICSSKGSRTKTISSSSAAAPAGAASAPLCVSSSVSSLMASSVSSSKEYDWEETTITSPDGTTRSVIIDRKTGIQYDILELLEKKVIDQSVYELYRSQKISFSQFAEIINDELKTREQLLTSHLITTKTTTFTESSCVVFGKDNLSSSELPKHKASVSIALAAPAEGVSEQNPVGAIFDSENVEKISMTEAMNRGLVDSITALRLLEAQACTGGIVNPVNGRRLSIQEASRQGIIDDKMADRLKPAQKAYIGFEDLKSKRKMSAAEAIKEHWLPYEAGQRFMEFQFVTGGLFDPELGIRRTIEDALKLGWLDGRTAQKLQDVQRHAKTLTCPKSKLKITYKEALDNCLLEENTGVRMLQASSTSSRGISSPYSVSPGPGSRSGSRTNSRRSSVDFGTSTRYSNVSYSRSTFSSGSTS
ncbi:desmoplakin-B [Aplochiton taeniatus]